MSLALKQVALIVRLRKNAASATTVATACVNVAIAIADTRAVNALAAVAVVRLSVAIAATVATDAEGS